MVEVLKVCVLCCFFFEGRFSAERKEKEIRELRIENSYVVANNWDNDN
jgi:hypothetical protein